MNHASDAAGAPRPATREAFVPLLSVFDVAAIIIGIVIGAGIFKTPSLVAGLTAGPWELVGLWLLGGLISLIGGLCYAELSATYPSRGGDYHFLQQAFGRGPARLFAWARLTIIQSGSIAMLAFLVGDYASDLLSLGPNSPALYAVGVVLLLTLVNLVSTRSGSRLQNTLSVAIILGILMMAAASLSVAAPETAGPDHARGHWGKALIFVLLTYSGWNEASYLSAEIRGPRQNITRALAIGLAVVTFVYLAANLAFLQGLGFANMARSEVVAADLMRRLFGSLGAVFVSGLVIVAGLGTMNGTIITGARTAYALGRDLPRLGFLGRWQAGKEIPRNALLVQSAITLGLVLAGSWSRSGFVAMVEYTAPVFWFFLLLVGLALFVLRTKQPAARPYSVPLYPWTPILFCVASAAMLASSLLYTGWGALVGVAVLIAGLPLVWGGRRKK